MADTALPWQLITALKARLQGISVANGYRTDIGQLVTDEAPQLDALVDTVAIYTTGIGKAGEPTGSRAPRTLQLSIEPILSTTVAGDGTTDGHARMHAAIADIEDALARPLGVAGVQGIEVEQVDVVNEPFGLPAIGATLQTTVEYLQAREVFP